MCVLSLVLASVGYCVCVCFCFGLGLVGYCVCCVLLYVFASMVIKLPWPRLVILTMTSVCVLALASVGYY